jgi:hypothetical protein
MSTREYIITGDPYVRPSTGQMRWVISERTDGGPWLAFADVAKDDAMDVLEVVRRAYRDGREDRSEELLA